MSGDTACLLTGEPFLINNSATGHVGHGPGHKENSSPLPSLIRLLASGYTNMGYFSMINITQLSSFFKESEWSAVITFSSSVVVGIGRLLLRGSSLFPADAIRPSVSLQSGLQGVSPHYQACRAVLLPVDRYS